MIVGNDGNDAELGADGYGAGKEFYNLLRPRRRYNIVIAGSLVENKIANTPADKICLVTGFSQPVNNFPGMKAMGMIRQ